MIRVWIIVLLVLLASGIWPYRSTRERKVVALRKQVAAGKAKEKEAVQRSDLEEEIARLQSELDSMKKEE